MKRTRFLILGSVLLLITTGSVYAQSNYFQFGNLNQTSVNVSSTWTKLTPITGTFSFNKSRSDSKIEVYVNSRFSVGTITGNGIRIQVRVDNNQPNFNNEGSLLKSGTSDFLSILSVFRSLPAGAHTVSIWAMAPSGSATSVIVDPGGWGGKIIVKETM